MKRTMTSLFIGLSIILLMNGCGSKTIQNVNVADLAKPIDKDKSIIEINGEKKSNLFSPDLGANGKKIGTLGSDKNLIWETNANSIECLSVYWKDTKFEATAKFLLIDELPFPYKCYLTKPGKITKLEYHIPNQWAATLTSLPLRKIANYNEVTKDKFRIDNISVVNHSKIDTDNDIVNIFKDKLSNHLKDNIVSSNETKSIDVFIEEYQEGNALGRWTYPTLKGSTILKIKVNVKKDNEIIDTYITRLSIISGGLLTIGGHEYIFDDAAIDITTYLLYD